MALDSSPEDSSDSRESHAIPQKGNDHKLHTDQVPGPWLHSQILNIVLYSHLNLTTNRGIDTQHKPSSINYHASITVRPKHNPSVAAPFPKRSSLSKGTCTSKGICLSFPFLSPEWTVRYSNTPAPTQCTHHKPSIFASRQGFPLPPIEPVPRRRHRLLEPHHPQKQILQRQQHHKHAIAQERRANNHHGPRRIQPVVVRGCDDHRQHERGIRNPANHVDRLPQLRLARLAAAEAPPEDAGVVDDGAANGEGVREVQGREGGELVEEFAGGPDGLRVVVADRVMEAIFLVEEARRHAWEEGEYGEGEEVGEGHGAADGGEGGMVGGDEVVPCDEAVTWVSRGSRDT